MFVKIQILGPLEVKNDEGERVTPRPLKLRSLLAALCVSSDRPVTAPHLIDVLWSDEPPRTASTALQVYVSKLRKHFQGVGIDPGVLATTPSGYVFRPGAQVMDCDGFDSLVAKARSAAAAGRAEEAASVFSEALALWNGPALADLRDVPALRDYAQQMDERRNAVYEQWLELEIGLGRHSMLTSELYGLIAEKPIWENLYFFLMIALYRSGRISECLDVYNRIRRILIEELGMEPGPRLQNLHHAVLSREPWLEPSAAPLAAVGARAS
ncbi:AfsR/SARP family transcriptional regulator [Streptomyces sp. SKN60]|uniref:AfsR/SARP family transcriptional regulator n=1 Tax=Streptomyces sp. SKN60 TaxID=2855506 RepID=UPI0022454A49|nr:AfsR/SARP family transcriptional regulator [Streptomyces sp. SKN60]